MSADSAAEARICEGRSAISFGNCSNLAGADFGPNIFAIMSGHISLLTMGESVWPRISPTTGTAGADKATTSGRTVG
jgi:hypothetical protein